MNLFDFAMDMELDGKAYYEKLALETRLPALRTIFTMLAADEQKHYDTVQAMRDKGGAAMADSSVLESARSVFADLRADPGIHQELRKAADGYRHAMKIEAQSVRLYEDMGREEGNREMAPTLQKIAEEERRHYNIMENLYDMALKPEYYLAWREFSNLQEF